MDRRTDRWMAGWTDRQSVGWWVRRTVVEMNNWTDGGVHNISIVFLKKHGDNNITTTIFADDCICYLQIKIIQDAQNPAGI